jgi:4-hydroxymandelate oxidase
MSPEKFPYAWSEIRAAAYEVFKAKKASRADVWVDAGGGAETGTTMRHQREMLDSLHFRMRAIHDIREADTHTSFLGQPAHLPIAIAPMSANITGFVDDTFAELGKGAASAGIIGSVGFPSSAAQHREMLGAGAPTFKIIKTLHDRDKLVQEFQTAEKDGCFAVGVDIDSAAGLKPGGDEAHYENLSTFYSVADLADIRKATSLPFIIKGIMSVADAVSAVEIGADAIVVSTHGGFALDFGQSPIEVMPEIVEAVGDHLEIWLDSGVRRGTDILKALALGAKGVLIGRLALWGLAIGGGAGVAHVVNLLGSELRRAMLLTGVTSVSDVSPEILVWPWE